MKGLAKNRQFDRNFRRWSKKKRQDQTKNQKGKLASLLTQTSNKNAEDAMLHVLNGDPRSVFFST